ncbi:MAG: fibronectin type III domain-containing protein [Patescibacteria group bacterium]
MKRIPTILGLLLLILATGVGVYLVKYPPAFFSRAEPGSVPSQIKITNISDNSFTVSWITEDGVSGFIKSGETVSLDQTFADNRDQISATTGTFQTHYVSLKNLKPSTKYFFKIGSGSKVYDDSGKPYEITTAPVLTAPSVADPAYGTILRSDGEAAEGAIVYLSMANTTPQSALVSTSGNWVIALNNARSSNLSSWSSYDPEASILEIFVQGENLQTATALTTTKNDTPVPTITLGKTYDFRKVLPPTEEETSPSEATPSSKFSLTELAPPKEATGAVELTIKSPQPNEKISTQKPEILGTGPAGKTIKIVVESPATYSASIKTDSQGNWKFSPPQNLTPGKHTVKVSFGGKTISRIFTVLAAGESELPAFTATPSATLTPTQTPTPTARLTPTLTPTPTATAAARTAMPATEAGVPTPGDLTPTFSIFIMGLILILSGFVVERMLAHAR